MKLSHEEVREILSIVENSSFDTIEIKVGDIQIAASKSGAPKAPTTELPRAQSATAAPAPTSSPTAPLKPEALDANEEGLVEIRAPIVGTFYVAPEPGAAPFIKPGDKVAPDTTIGIIEVMKVFNDVRAKLTGEVVSCLVSDGDLVEFEQPIFLIRPEG